MAYDVIGDEGIISRFGGEEFAVLLPGLNRRKFNKSRTITRNNRKPL
ncbi:hypothetical protein GLW05_05050 [Pontibacillus yanchengensis]|uniref:GGDEF domain-containing protein n=1 Tax=Pontibacillus yanchengensis TaxID=462910 RepID=A0A6I4ZYD9_9BACI|nr:hypothetical protein [Pontibacillus yanchengensis]